MVIFQAKLVYREMENMQPVKVITLLLIGSANIERQHKMYILFKIELILHGFQVMFKMSFHWTITIQFLKIIQDYVLFNHFLN